MVTPSSDDMRSAALWLDHNEGDEAEREPMARVARWLEEQADAQDIRTAARAHNLTVKDLRAAIAKRTP